MASEVCGELIEKLLLYGIKNKLIKELDLPLVRNDLLSLMHLKEPAKLKISEEEIQACINATSPVPILEALLDIAVSEGLIEDNITERDLFDGRMMGKLMPRPSELAYTYESIRAKEGNSAATDYFYKLSQASNYIRMDRIRKNMYWKVKTQYGDLEITINLSKPEKDPKEIAKARLLPQVSYPKCLLCLENVGYEGRLNYPGRANHRVLPLTLDKEAWYFQYSPYVYYNEHAIVFKGKHQAMKIQRKTFVRLLDFIEIMPHYFLGSNADLPIVGGSILSHDHFQGGHHQFPMEVAPIIIEGKDINYPNIHMGIVKWPLSVIRLSGPCKEDLVELSDRILKAWRNYSDEKLSILAYSDIDGEKIPHNTITPISRRNKDKLFELDLVLRNNRQDIKHPDGIFHPHRHLHHIKKENIGLIEVMGLAVLPARLKEELQNIEKVLTHRLALQDLKPSMDQHRPWIQELIKKYGDYLAAEEARQVIKKEVGQKFAEVLACAGVYKLNDEGLNGFKAFLESISFEF